MKRAVVLAVAVGIAAGIGSAFATTAPKDGGPLPKAYRDRLAEDKSAYQMRRAWIQKAERVREARRAYLEAEGPQALAAPLPQQYVVSGTVAVPVLAGYYQNHTAPYAVSTLQDKLFDNASGTVTDYYDEVSYGNVVMTGTVYGWTQVSQVDTYYEGPSNGLDPINAHTGEFIKELLDAHDGSVDFGQYDNDGPDGVPNSGDDDGYVDFAAFVHNEAGGECGGGSANVWSHRWVYEAWSISGGLPYTTNDAAAGGGFIRVSDYVIQPAYNCASSGGGVIDIGVFCHEFGHAFGLPDLYDTNGGGNGIGFWGIMGSGNWNSPSSPAHPCAWTREALGWIAPTVIDWMDTAANIPDINTNPVAYKLPFTDDRWRRNSACVISGGWSLYCGLSEAEATARGWASPGPGGGYGNNWVETVERQFTYSGTGSVSFEFDYDYDLETNYDFAHVVIEVAGVETGLESYTGAGSGTEVVDLTPHLSPLSGIGGTYTLMFRVITDFSFADDDGGDGSTCGAIAVDDVSVTGGGESYSTNFETWVDGWHQNPADHPATEYWLVENRRATGFDANLIQPGLLIMQIDQEVMWSNFLGNSGGSSGLSVRGVVVEEANGDFDLNGATSNRGEATDPFPGTSGKTSFTSATTPGSNDNTARPTHIQVTGISAAAPTMSASLRAGDPAPQASSVSPPSADNDETAVAMVITGDGIRHGATFHLVPPVAANSRVEGEALVDVVATDVEWVDPTRLTGTVNVYGREDGDWDVVVTNPDGQTVTLADAFTVNFAIVATQLQSADLRVAGGAVELSYELLGQEPGEVIRLYRASAPAGDWRLIEDDLRGDSRGVYEYRDTAVEPGRTYYYRLASVLDGEVRELHRGSASVPAQALALLQNVPNPFNPTTTIGFTLPERGVAMVQVYDVSGALVRELAGREYGAGPHEVQWNGRDQAGNAVGSGVYFYRLIAGNRTLTRKMVLLK